MPPNGRRGSDFTMPLTKTEPASISTARRSCSAGSRGPGARRRGRRPCRWRARSPRRGPRTRKSAATGPKSSSSPGRRAGHRRRRAPSAGRSSPARSSGSAAQEQPRPGRHRALHLLGELVADRRGGERADLGRRVHRIADLERRHAADEARRERVVDRLVDDEALGRDAGLAVVDRARLDRGARRPSRGRPSAAR